MTNSLIDRGRLTSEFFYLEIKEVQSGDRIWSDAGSGAESDVSFWRVKPSTGFYTFGDFATNFHNIKPDEGRRAPVTITVACKPGYEDLLKEPLDYEKIWDDADSGADEDCAIWRMKCPDGYVSLGDVVTNGEKPSGNSFRCIKKIYVNKNTNETVQLVTGAAFMDFAPQGETTPRALWTDAGSGASKSVSIWLMRNNRSPANRNQVYLGVGTFKANQYHDRTPLETGYSLVLNFPQKDALEKVEMQGSKVKLTGPRMPTEEEMQASKDEQDYYVPFFAVNDPEYPNQLEQFRVSPTYHIRRTSVFEAIDSFEPINTETKEFSVMIGKSEETNYNNEVGVTLGLAFEVGGEAGIPLASTSVKVTASVELSYSHSWGGATSSYREKSFTYPQTVTGGSFGVLFQAKSTYVIYRQDGTSVGAPLEIKTNQFYTDEWRPDGILSSSSSEEGTAKTNSPNTITFTIEAPPGKTIILEGRLEIRDGQLTSIPAVITMASVPPISAAPVGQSLLFDSSTSPMIVNNKLSSSYTKEAWIKIPPSSDSNHHNIISGGQNGQHAFLILKRQVCAGHNGAWSSVKCDEPVSDGWEHYAVTYNAEAQEMKLYKNGKMVSSSNLTAPYKGGNFVQVGKYDSANEFKGEMAEIRIWNNVRTEEQIASQMKVSVPNATAGLIAKYPAS